MFRGLQRKMGSQRKSSQGSRHFLTSILLTAAVLVLPALSLDSLLCYFCPLQHKGKSCPNITSQCLPHQRCSSSRGRYGPVHVLSAQGCVDSELCGSHEILSHRGVKYNVSHTCCCRDKCNDPPKPDTNLRTLIKMIADRIDQAGVANVTKEELWDSCANYTSSMNSTLPAATS
ncbi:protein Bouncer-like [Acanthopagrus latus]|uniref:protein Bouncer-like n=1 Tax=Acanthopagrus latus TaxID=8177 RepID=UPI00187C0AA2|nr:protein Bouncer-like [Acanthopagrus latus]